MTTYDQILILADKLIQQRGFLGFSYLDLEKIIGIKKASIHHHFPKKTDLGLAYCIYKANIFDQLNTHICSMPPGMLRLKSYLEAFSGCAERGEMCGIYAMLSDYYQFSPDLQKAVSQLAKKEILILENILDSGQKNGEINLIAPPGELAVIVCSALKGALMLNRTSNDNTYTSSIKTLIEMLDANI